MWNCGGYWMGEGERARCLEEWEMDDSGMQVKAGNE